MAQRWDQACAYLTRCAITRLQLLRSKRTELSGRSKREIASLIAAGKYELAKIRVRFQEFPFLSKL
jgi:hypothetical protein